MSRETVVLPAEDVRELIEAAAEAKHGVPHPDPFMGGCLPLPAHTEDRLGLDLETIKQEMFSAGVRA